MASSVPCPCGNRLQPRADQAGAWVRCPACGRALAIPGGLRTLWPRLAAAAGITLLAVVGLGLLFAKAITRPTDKGPAPVAAAPVAPKPTPPIRPAEPVPPLPKSADRPAAQPERPDLPDLPAPPLAREDPSKRPTPAPPPTNPPPKPPASEARPAVASFEPAEPRAGGKLTVRLQGGAKKGTTYQYRPAGAVGWQTAADGAVQVADLKAGDYTLEFRTLDADGKPSPVVARTWKVNPTPPVVVKSVPGLRQGDRFFQEVVVRRVSSYSVLGAPLSQDVRYTLVSSFRIDKLAADGSMEVTQKVEGVHLSDAAPAMLAQLNDLLQKTKGATFILTLNAKREVTSFKGADAALKVFKGANPLGGQSFLLWSFLDRDGWKELAGITFFRPEKPLRRGEKWARKMTHSWGPLGRWVGKVAYVNAGSKGDLHQFNYVLDMAYRPPAAGAAAALPFKIAKADFRVLVARGAIVYDAAKGRVARAEELFSVRGILAVEVLGTSSPVEMDEKQVFQIRVLDRNPLTK